MFKRWENERGEVMLEASIILVSILTLCIGMLSLSFMFYQQALMNTVATETATSIAKNFKYTSKDIKTNTFNSSDSQEFQLFRLTLMNEKIEDMHEDSAQDYAEWRVSKASLGLNPGEVKVKCEIENSSIGRAYVKVTVSQETKFFLSGMLEYLGITDKEMKFEATAYAECTDLIGYTSMINFTQYISKNLTPFEALGNFYVNFKDLLANLSD